MEINKVKSQLLPSLTFSLMSLFIFPPVYFSTIVDSSRVSLHSLGLTEILTAVGSLWLSDVLFSFVHKYVLHIYKPQWHKLHHCCKHAASLNTITLHPMDYLLEFGVMLFMPTLLLYACRMDTALLIVSMFVFLCGSLNHSNSWSTEHEKVHHQKTSPSYNCFPILFHDWLQGDRNTSRGKEKQLKIQ